MIHRKYTVIEALYMYIGYGNFIIDSAKLAFNVDVIDLLIFLSRFAVSRTTDLLPATKLSASNR